MLHTQNEFEGRPVEDAVIDRQELIGALAKLTPKQREAVLLTASLGLTQEEAGRVTGVTKSAINQRLGTAKT